MKNTMSKALWGVFFVLLGMALAGRAVGIFDFNIYFPGWWTLFIIVPSAIGLAGRENRTASIFGLGTGILLLASVQGLIDWYTFPKLIIALIFIVIGSSFLFKKERRTGREDYDSEYGNDHQDSGQYGDGDWNGGYQENRDYENQEDGQDYYEDQGHDQGRTGSSYNSTGSYHSDSGSYHDFRHDRGNTKDGYSQEGGSDRGNYGGYNHYTGFLSGRNIQFIDEEFKGADVTSILGNVQLDLRNAIFRDDVIIDTTCILGGVDVYVPGNVKVVLNCTPILGGVENKVRTPFNMSAGDHTLFIRGTCILGGIEVK